MAFHSIYGSKLGVDETGSLVSDSGTKTVTSVGAAGTGTATLNKSSGKVTTPALTTAAGATHVLTLTNSKIKATDMVLVTVGTGGTGTPTVGPVTPANGSVVITIQNIHASVAFSAAIAIGFLVIKP